MICSGRVRPGRFPTAKPRAPRLSPPGTQLEAEAAKLIHLLAWQGKVFDASAGELRNKILPIGLHAIVAKVYKGTSWYDSKECIVLDYSKTSLIAHWIRDEIRQVGDGVYLGIVYWSKKKLIDFCAQIS